jgi:hypothetical protein
MKATNIKFYRSLSSGSLTGTCEQTDRQQTGGREANKAIFATNAPKKELCLDWKFSIERNGVMEIIL